jgi:hypothetical protein
MRHPDRGLEPSQRPAPVVLDVLSHVPGCHSALPRSALEAVAVGERAGQAGEEVGQPNPGRLNTAGSR